MNSISDIERLQQADIKQAIDLDAIERRWMQTTPGPWTNDFYGVYTLNPDCVAGPVLDGHDRENPPHNGIGRAADAYPRGHNHPLENLVFIANAWTDIPVLIREVRRLRAFEYQTLSGKK